jgi:glutathione peroxidase
MERRNVGARAMTTVYDFSAKTLAGEEKSLGDYRGQVLLIVNTASKCGFTPQYEGLEKLYEKLHDKGLTVLGFPCNQFGAQEPGTESEIGAFCQKNYGVSFPMFAKIDVNGEAAHPLYKFLKKEERGVLGSQAIKWNFTKFLVDRDGNPVERYGSTTKPEDLEGDILKLL